MVPKLHGPKLNIFRFSQFLGPDVFPRERPQMTVFFVMKQLNKAQGNETEGRGLEREREKCYEKLIWI